ncbi:hypothetical protein Xish_02462 [Xenorhabdus ishibashii]|uniref:Uncharacterized protein n=1 Tax=Xenorhabdus ishibashii TaxID=1034471 RepID=A0A2D0KIJ9_9GAMM|nr:hypothetical protein Xish_02462 [Xenorhabdus ishibashii]
MNIPRLRMAWLRRKRMKYYVHTKTDNQGDHEVHREGCNRMPLDEIVNLLKCNAMLDFDIL